jgi:2-methylcitrate dehydratase PrpD
MTIGSIGPGEASLARQLARAARAVDLGHFDADVIAEAKICLLDFLSCAFEAKGPPMEPSGDRDRARLRRRRSHHRDQQARDTNALQAEMSIPFSVAAALARGALEEDNYAQIDNPETLRLVDRTDLRSEAGFTAAFPANQGAEVPVGRRNGATVRQRLAIYCGVPAGVDAFRNAREVFAELDQKK